MKIEEDGKTIESNEETSEVFNIFFQDKIKKLRDRINNDFKCDPMGKMDEKMNGKEGISFQLKTVSEEKVLSIIKSIKPKHSCGFDGITANLLKKTAEIIYIPLTRIINSSITSGIFPEDWKLAVVKPLF